jgi:hypothetical protein
MALESQQRMQKEPEGKWTRFIHDNMDISINIKCFQGHRASPNMTITNRM